MVVYRDELSEPVHYSEPTFLLQVLYNHLNWAVAIFLLVCQEFERMDQVAANSVAAPRALETLLRLGGACCLVRPNPVRSFPIVLAAAGRTPPAALPSVPR